MNEKLTVRFAEPEDASILARMLHDFNREFDDPSPGTEVLERRVGAFIADGRMTFLLGGEGPDGFAQFSYRPSIWSDDPIAYLEEFYVVPELRGRGTGKAIMQTLFEEAHRRGAAGIELVTGEDDTGARALYKKFGFRNEIEGTENARSLFYEINF